ncbi:MAG: hypothetical protein UU21_C0004G0048 [Candidatus Levybacteria bacterium GW2011_GWA2_40_8]|nr:MAG: hypothetical protein UU21_C0004G0048 [Candidatus Levybacteria bacterium GW2011_GWA2_40_8]
MSQIEAGVSPPGTSPATGASAPKEKSEPPKSLSEPDNVGLPNYSALTEEARIRETRASMNPGPDRADFFLREGSRDYPPDYREPGPFEIQGEREWKKFVRRRDAIERRHKEELIGDDIVHF